MRPGRVLTLVVALCCACVACSGDHAQEPTIATPDFTPKATISVSDAGITCQQSGDAPSCHLATGNVVAVTNTGSSVHRVQGDDGKTFDTGIMQPGDTMTLVLGDAGDMDVTDLDAPDHTLTITVLERQDG